MAAVRWRGDRETWRQVLRIGIPIAVYVTLSVIAFWPLAPWDARSMPVCNCGDYVKMGSFLEFTPWAILHSHNPFYTTYVDYPHGANYAINTTMPFVGVLMAPVSLTAGPIVAMNLVAHLAFVLSATSMFLVLLKRWVPWAPAAFAGGLLFGFSPFMTDHSYGHPNLTFVPLIPILLLLVDEVLVRQSWSARRAGLLLGVVAAAQYGISSELLADAAILAALVAIGLALWRSSEVRRRARHVLQSVAWSLASFIPLTGYPIYMAVAGPGHLSGPEQPIASLDRYRADVLSAVYPTRFSFFSLGHLGVVGSRFAAENTVENAAYIGIPLLVLLAYLVIRYRRDPVIVVSTSVVALTYLISMGVVLNFDGQDTGIWLPFRVFAHLPLLDSLIAIRWFLFGYLFLALALARGLWRMRGGGATEPAEASEPRRGRSAWLSPAAVGVVAAVALLPLVPRWPYPLSMTPVPAYFETAADYDQIPSGTPVLIYPASENGVQVSSVLWQAETQMRFRLLDADAARRGQQGEGVSFPPLLKPLTLEVILVDAETNPKKKSPLGMRMPPLDAATIANVRASLTRYDISTVIVDPVGYFPQTVLKAIELATGHRPVMIGGVWVFYGIQRDLRAG